MAALIDGLRERRPVLPYTASTPLTGHCCRTLSAKVSQCESMRLDGVHEHACTRPLPHYELVQLHGVASQARLALEQFEGSALAQSGPPNYQNQTCKLSL